MVLIVLNKSQFGRRTSFDSMEQLITDSSAKHHPGLLGNAHSPRNVVCFHVRKAYISQQNNPFKYRHDCSNGKKNRCTSRRQLFYWKVNSYSLNWGLWKQSVMIRILVNWDTECRGCYCLCSNNIQSHHLHIV